MSTKTPYGRTLFKFVAVPLVAPTVMFAQEALSPAGAERGAIERVPSQSVDAPGLKKSSEAKRMQVKRRADGALLAASSFETRSYSGSKLEAARSFLAEHRSLFGRVATNDLDHVNTRAVGSRTYVRFQQQLNGVPVRGAHLVVQVDSANRVKALTSRLEPSLNVDGAWTTDEETAIARALEGETGKLRDKPSAAKIYVMRNRKAIPVWQVVVRTTSPAGEWEYLVSASDGSVIEKHDLRHGDSAQGFAYAANPTKGDIQQVPLDNLASATRLTSDQTRVFSYLPALLGQVEPNTFVQLATRQNGNFFYPTDDPRFSEVQMYYGMERANARFRNLGFPGWDEPLPGIVYFQDYNQDTGKFAGSDNAYFSPLDASKNGGMFFYLTNRNGDTSLDSDVIFHEYTHSIVNYIVGPYQSATFSALNEGTADYFSDSFLDDPVEGEYAAKIFRMRTGYIRRADNDNGWPYNTVGEAHVDGNIWTGALWDIRNAGGAEAADNIAINALLLLSPNSEFYDAASAAITAADSLYGSDAAATVEEIMTNRGIYSEAAQTASEAVSMKSGDAATGHISAADTGSLLVAAQQYRIVVPNGATKFTIGLDASSSMKFYIRYRVPITVEDGYIKAEQVSKAGRSVSGSLTLNNTPELQAGTYYVAVVNTTTKPADYELKVSIEGGDPKSGAAVTLLAGGETGTGSVPSGPFLASRQFAIDVPEGTHALRVKLDGDQDVDLYVRFNNRVYVNNAGFPEADLISDSDASTEQMTISLNSGAPIPAGRYYIGVYNYSNETARYQVRADIQ